MPPNPDLWELLFLIGIQELGKGFLAFSRDDKINLMHIGLCSIMEPFGYCKRKKELSDGWPDFEILRPLPPESDPSYEPLVKKGIIDYLKRQDLI